MSQSINQQAIVPYSAQQMYTLVNDVAKYPEFLPWCEAVDILETMPNFMRATVHFAYKGIKHRFTTANTLSEDAAITMSLVAGPFSALTGQWQFQDLGAGCQIHFSLNFAFSNKLFSYAFAKVFTMVADTMVAAFIERAAILYAAPPLLQPGLES